MFLLSTFKEIAVARLICLVACVFACAIAAAPAAADRTGNSCLAKTKGPYGFHCHGSTLVGNPQAGFQFGPGPAISPSRTQVDFGHIPSQIERCRIKLQLARHGVQ